MPASGGTLSLLFTDLVESTSTANRLGDDRAQALRRAHDRILLHQFETHEGTVVKNTGDGFFAVFSSAKQAVACARDIQRAIADQQAEGRYAELSVRIGIHTGEPTEEHGDYFGADVALAARVQSEAGAGEILISDVTRLLVRSHDITVEDAGARSLKGFSDPLQTYRVVWRREESQRRQSRFIGRLEEKRRLGVHLDALLMRRRGGVVLIAGEPGIGKTRLATEFAIDAQDRGALVLTGRAYESEGLPPYHPFAEAFARHVLTHPTDGLTELLGKDAPYLARIAPEIRNLIDVQEPDSSIVEAERHLLLDAAARFLTRLSAETPLLLILDDFHWADHASIYMLQHVIRRLESLAVLIVVTYREVEAAAGHPLSTLAAEIARRGPGECITLSPLSATESSSLVQDVFGDRPPDDVVSALYATAEGNPFFTEELVRNLRGKAPEQVGLVRRPPTSTVPEAVRQVIVQRLGLVAEPVFELLTECAVLGHGFTLARVAAITGLDQETLLDRIEVALDARALREAGDALEFAHPLIRETLYQSLPNARRRALHRSVAQGLEQLAETDMESHVSELAHHYLEGATEPAHAGGAVAYATRAAKLALGVFANDKAAAHLQQAYATLERLSLTDTPEAGELLIAMGEAEAKAGDAVRAESSFMGAVRIAQHHRRPEMLARAALGVGDVRRAAGIVDEQLISLLEQALAAIPSSDSALRTMLLARLSTAYSDTERQRAVSAKAVDMARRLGDDSLLCHAKMSALFLSDPADLEGRAEAALDLIELATRIGHREHALYGRQYYITQLIEKGDLDRAYEEMRLFSEEASLLRQPFYLWLCAVFEAMRALLEARFDDAERLAQAALAAGQEVQSGTNLAFQFFSIQLFAMRWEQGRLAELKDVVAGFIEQYPALRWRVGLAFLHSELGDRASAKEELERIFDGHTMDIPDNSNKVISLAFLAEVCSSLEDVARAPIVHQALLPFDGRNAIIGSPAACMGAVARSLALLEVLMERWDDAERHFEGALQMNTRMNAPALVARTQTGYARMLLARRRPGDAHRAVDYLLQARNAAEALGLPRLLEEIAALQEPLQATP